MTHVSNEKLITIFKQVSVEGKIDIMGLNMLGKVWMSIRDTII